MTPNSTPPKRGTTTLNQSLVRGGALSVDDAYAALAALAAGADKSTKGGSSSSAAPCALRSGSAAWARGKQCHVVGMAPAGWEPCADGGYIRIVRLAVSPGGHAA